MIFKNNNLCANNRFPEIFRLFKKENSKNFKAGKAKDSLPRAERLLCLQGPDRDLDPPQDLGLA